MRHPGIEWLASLMEELEHVEGHLTDLVREQPKARSTGDACHTWQLKNGGCNLRIDFRPGVPVIDMDVTNGRLTLNQDESDMASFRVRLSVGINREQNKLAYTHETHGVLPQELSAIVNAKDGFHYGRIVDVAEWFANLELEADLSPPASSPTGFVDMG